MHDDLVPLPEPESYQVRLNKTCELIANAAPDFWKQAFKEEEEISPCNSSDR